MTLRLANALYLVLPRSWHRALHGRYAGLFRDSSRQLADGRWIVRLAGRSIQIPIHRDRAWLDWDAALSALGHEPSIKQTYETLLVGEAPPQVFVDVGANYGVHSLFFLVAGVETLTIEPNSGCHPYFQELCDLNAVSPRLVHAALGTHPAVAELYFPERETWLGSIEPSVVERLQGQPGVKSEQIAVRRLDEFLPHLLGKRVLIKIDAEDHEHAVLRGGEATLDRVRPLVIFESHRANARAALFELFATHEYRVAALPLISKQPLQLLDLSEFLARVDDDFIAVPAERCAARADPGSLFAESR